MMLRTAGRQVGQYVIKGVKYVFDRKTLSILLALVISFTVLIFVIDNIRARRDTVRTVERRDATISAYQSQAAAAAAQSRANGQQLTQLQAQLAQQEQLIRALQQQLQNAGITPVAGTTNSSPSTSGGTSGSSGSSSSGGSHSSGGSGGSSGGHSGGSGGGGSTTPPPTKPPPVQPPPVEPPPVQPPHGPGGIVGVVCTLPIVNDLLC
jgi:hypothetical protein